MKKLIVVILVLLFSVVGLKAQLIEQAKPIVNAEVVFNEENGIVAVEGEHFYKQTNTEIRQWFITSKGKVPEVKPDPDGEHIDGASGNAYIEILPDTRTTHSCKLYKFEEANEETFKLVNFTDLPGKVAVLHYKVKINKSGRYYVWVRIFSTGSEDNGVHVGLDGAWPENGKRMQWCEGKNSWTWESKQRTEKEHCGVPKQIFLDIPKAGIHDIQFSMREDGFEIDKFILANDINYVPQGKGPACKLYKSQLLRAFEKVLKADTSGH